MKRVFGKIEIVFDITYLIIVAYIAVMMAIQSSTNAHYVAIIALILGLGDAFHLIPRIMVIKSKDEQRYRKYLGRGKQITSITMSIFYLLLYLLLRRAYPIIENNVVDQLIYILVVVRIILCLLPQNQWTLRYPPISYSVIRNIPFFMLGALMVFILYQHRMEVEHLSMLWLAIILSFAFYLPVTIWANKYSKIGMLMLPKTLCYVWVLLMLVAAFKI
ncbi:MAG: hypothetical protein EOM50_19005 [Erysipelotrichia bacterium]|nr:hypothetical protein [Erysipelotrichia bacterium]